MGGRWSSWLKSRLNHARLKRRIVQLIRDTLVEAFRAGRSEDSGRTSFHDGRVAQLAEQLTLNQ